MIERRQLLKAALGVTAASTFASHPQIARGQTKLILNSIFETKVWNNPKDYERYRFLVGTLINMRFVYNGPNGYENDIEFLSGAYQLRTQVMGKSPQDGLAIAQQSISEKPIDDLPQQMSGLLAKNEEKFVSWLSEIGVQKDSRIQIDLLTAQALFAASAAHVAEDQKLTSFGKFTWIYPFC